MEEIEFSLPILLPMLFLVGAMIFTRRRKLSSRIIWTGVVTLLSLPIGIAAIFEPMIMVLPPHYEINPGTGVAAAPLIVGWVASVMLWLLGSALALARSAISAVSAITAGVGTLGMTAALFILLASLTACVALTERALETDKVRDAEAAIQIAKAVCKVRSDDHSEWTAVLHDRVWQVDQQLGRKVAGCRTGYGAPVPADTGEARYCTVCVTAT